MNQMGDAMSKRPTPLDPALNDRLHGVIRRVRRCLFTVGVANVFVLLAACALLQHSFDWVAGGMRWSMRAAVLILCLAVISWRTWRTLVSPLTIPFSIADIARLLERRYPQLSSALISAVRFSSGEVGPAALNSPALMADVVRQAARATAPLPFDVVLNPGPARRSAAIVAIIVVIFSLLVAVNPDRARLWLERSVLLRDIPWPKRTRLVVELADGVLFGARGDDLIVQAHAEGVQPRDVEIRFETRSGLRGRLPMVTVGTEGDYRYRYVFPSAREDFDFYLVGGDDRTDVFQARLRDRPRVVQSSMVIRPPTYSRLETVTLGDGQRSAQALPGSDVSITVRTNHPVTGAVLMADRMPIAPAESDGGEGRVVTFEPDVTRTYHFALVDAFGLEDRHPVRFSIQMLKDDPPRVRMKLVGVGDMITPEAVLPIDVEFADTYGLASAELFHRVEREDAADQLIDLPSFGPGGTTLATSISWPVSIAGVTPGDRIALWVASSDFDNVNGPNTARSPMSTLRVVSRDELMAEFIRREQELRMDFERLVDAQEQLRGALLSAQRPDPATAEASSLAGRLEPLERRQRSLAGSIHVVRQQFEHILIESRINRLDVEQAELRIGEGIVEPLGRLTRRAFVLAAEAIRHWSLDPSVEKASETDRRQVEIIEQLRIVLNNMLQWEGYQEAVSMLRDIVRLQEELNRETRKSVEEHAGGVFDD